MALPFFFTKSVHPFSNEAWTAARNALETIRRGEVSDPARLESSCIKIADPACQGPTQDADDGDSSLSLPSWNQREIEGPGGVDRNPRDRFAKSGVTVQEVEWSSARVHPFNMTLS